MERWLFDRLLARIAEPLAPVLLVRGPRQVGKSTLQQQLIQRLLSSGFPARSILRAQFEDVPSLRRSSHALLDVAAWYETNVLGETFNEAAHAGRQAVLFLDEAQNLTDWDAQLKQLVDNTDVVCVVTGSSALRIGLGRDSLAGRLQSFDLGTLRLSEIAEVRGYGQLPPFQRENGWADWLTADFWSGLRKHGAARSDVRDLAMAAFSERGAYPRSHVNADVPWNEVADQLNETVVRRVIQHDLRLGDRGRKRDPQLLEEVFRLACRYAGQAPRPALLATEARTRLQANVGDQRIRHYLDFLDSSLLVRQVPALEIRLKKQRSSARLCLCDHGVRAAWLQEEVPLDPVRLAGSPHLSSLAGHLVESVVGYYLTTLSGLDVAHLPERPGTPEVDFVVTVGTRRVPIEVKYQRRIHPEEDIRGLTAFLDLPANEASTGVLICQDANEVEVEDSRVVPVSFADFLLVR
ncbi:ATP-binding protein [Kineococcus sp. TBRC 1896]|uniref:ATP-binding protein n=1 Tax=Kineococcus mangrovi TaxID=1660183 RepID=A0ABV4I2K2_9ACTN